MLGGVIKYLARVRYLLILASIRYYIYKHKTSSGIVNQTIELYLTRQLSELQKNFTGQDESNLFKNSAIEISKLCGSLQDESHFI